jgi:hypothetical protein
MAAAVGFVNVNQNMIIKIFSAAGAVVPMGYFTNGEWLR